MTQPWTESMHEHFHKWHLTPSGRIMHWLNAPDSGDPHDHPFDIEIEILYGAYTEEIWSRNGNTVFFTRNRGDRFTIRAKHIHRIVQLHAGECFILCRYGVKVQEPGFYRREDKKLLRRQHDKEEWIDVCSLHQE